MSRSRAATAAAKRRSKAPARRPARRSSPPRRAATKRAAPRRAASAPAKRRPRSLRPLAPRSWRRRLLALAVLGLVLAAGYHFWLRDSSLVAVDDVDVVGVTAEREQIVGDLTAAAEQMTTLHVDRERIERAAAAYPTIKSVGVDPNFPHGMRIEVVERPPTLLVHGGDEAVPVAADGTLLAGVPVPDGGLPSIELDQVPAAGALGGEPLEQALIVGATPEPLRPLIEKVDHRDDYGVEIVLRGGIPVRFGSGSAAAEKWAAAAAVLADPKLEALSYLDVRVPERPAAGGAGEAAPAPEPPA